MEAVATEPLDNIEGFENAHVPLVLRDLLATRSPEELQAMANFYAGVTPGVEIVACNSLEEESLRWYTAGVMDVIAHLRARGHDI